ncbi:glycosyltransferase [Leisingera aquaemixtae]|uniref:Putative glycosyltransferase EpsD n=1 Tax=Leisingera aquaemixtae TaxID=1396826 RepID=A0A0N7M4A6_9RHOB|nr:glycosyltransferase [Leisingera aquaemixtae]CUH99098.1 Putative glycosyltransferase EpsD [Leisingera aquaemixtae]
MKVLFLTVRADLGGGPEHLYQLLKHRPKGIGAYVACPDDKPYHDRYRALLGPDRIVPLPHRAFSLGSLAATARFIRREGIDVLHSHGKGAGLYARVLGLWTGRPVVHTFHGLHTGEYSPLKKALYLRLEQLLGLGTQKAICVSEGEARLIREAGVSRADKLAVIPNGIEIPETVTRPRWDGGMLRLLAVSRYDHQKNPDLLIDIAKALSGSLRFHLDVIGTGERLPQIQQRLNDEGLAQHVTLHGGVANPRDHFRRAHAFVSTSRWEGMPLAVLEAMSEALCVLATDVVGNADVIRDGKTGRLFRTSDEAVRMLQGLTVEDCARLSAAARREAEQTYSADVMAAKTYQVYGVAG